MSGPTRLLLDKSVVRRYFEGTGGLARGLALTDEEQQAILLVHLARGKGYRLFLSTEAHNLLLAHGRQVAPTEMLMFLKRVEVLYPTRYFKRSGRSRGKMRRCWRWLPSAPMKRVTSWVSTAL